MACWCGDKGWRSGTAKRHVAWACARSVVACASHMLLRACACWRVEYSAGVPIGSWRRVKTPMTAIPTPNDRSAGENSDDGAAFWIGARKTPLLIVQAAAARERSAGVPIGAWRRVPPLMAVLPPYNDRSGDDLSIGGGLDLSRCLERRFRRLWWLGRAWWRVGSPAEYSNGAWERVKALMTTISQGFLDQATIYPMVKVVAWLDAWKLEFRGLPCFAELGCSEIAPVHAKTPGNAVPTDGAIVGGQNSSSHLFLGLKPQVRALVWLGTKWENDTRFTVVRPMGPTST